MARFLITCGPTREPLDPVRYLSNGSSGRTGLAIAGEALARGHTVDLVLGPVELAPPQGARVVPVITCAEMLAACLDLHGSAEAVVGAAAVCDFRPAASSARKRRREAGAWNLELVANPDILRELGARKGSRVHAGFALETGEAAESLRRARRKLEEKGLDWIVVNSPEALGGEGGSYHLLGRSGPPESLGALSKRDLARRLIQAVENSLKAARGEADKAR
jgi:phosphopantothenoylcysteine decarboxylase/phosphopantothenate--cysteine ligase